MNDQQFDEFMRNDRRMRRVSFWVIAIWAVAFAYEVLTH